MTTATERRIDKLQRLLRARTRADGSPLKGYEQNVPVLRAQIDQILEAEAARKEDNDAAE